MTSRFSPRSERSSSPSNLPKAKGSSLQSTQRTRRAYVRVFGIPGASQGHQFLFCIRPDAMIVRLRRRAGSSSRPPMLKALAAIYGTPLRRLERNGRLFPALRAHRFRLYALDASRACFISRSAVCFAGLATLGFVLKSLVREKHLLAGGEDEFRSTIGALQNLVIVFHTLLRGPGSLGAGSGAVRGERSNKIPRVLAVLIRPPARSCLERLK